MRAPTPNTSHQGFPGWLVLLGTLTAVAPLSIDMYLPSFSQVEHALGSAGGRMEFTLASFFIGLMLGQLFYGPVSDRFGRKPPLYLGFALYTAASVGCALADSIPALTAWRFLQGLGGCAGIIIPSAMVRDRTTARESARAFSLLMLVMGLAPILAPLVGGGLLALWGWRAIFAILAGFGALCLIAVSFGLAESHDTTHEPPLRLGTVLRNYGQLFASRAFLGYTLGGGLSMAGMFAYIAGSPFVLIDLYGIPPQHYGWFFGANAFGLIASSQLNARLLQKFPATTLLRWALWVPPIVGLGLAVLAFSGMISLAWFVVGFFCFVSSIGWIIPNATAAALATHGQMAGTAAALSSAVQFLFATIAGALVGILHDGSGRPLAGIMALCGLGAWACHRLLVRHHDEHHHRGTKDGPANP
ncbi:MAG: Bcr/CflA family multidrug efflux MFS transporter [Rhodocyclaceae bacterium]|nr:MAG: Bcr/CflA family multidrug efflux MFS transporter [Rhodocyclaceae bacterium]